jgi:RNA polymerase sigma-70 factor (ECF subfamily)
MRDSDVLDNNPRVSRSALEAMHGQVFGWALSRCNYEQELAEDLVQQAYVELLTGRARFDGESSLQTFVFSVVQNLARGRFRRRATHLRLVHQAAPADDVQQFIEPAQNEGVWEAVRALPARQRDIVELVFCRDLTVDGASRVMGVSAGTGRVHYDRAKKALREKLKHE